MDFLFKLINKLKIAKIHKVIKILILIYKFSLFGSCILVLCFKTMLNMCIWYYIVIIYCRFVSNCKFIITEDKYRDELPY